MFIQSVTKNVTYKCVNVVRYKHWKQIVRYSTLYKQSEVT